MLVALMVALALPGLRTLPTAGAQAAGSVVDVHPRPAAVVDLAAVELRALIATDATVDEVTVTVDGAPVASTSRTVTSGVEVVAGLPPLDPGVRRLRVSATTSAGDLDRAWSVTATGRTVTRLAGDTRHATAAEVSRDLFPGAGSVDAVVLARSDEFADALAGGPLATHLGGPLLLTDTTALPAVTHDEVDRVLGADGTVHVLGGEVAVASGVVDELEAHGHRVIRHAGPTRHDTAVEIAAALPPSTTAVVASGRVFPDALAASVPAARAGWPILLTEPDALPAATRDGIDRIGVDDVVVVGGEVAVAAAVVDELEEQVVTTRVAGDTRYGTAVAIADAYLPDAVDEVAVASGTTFPDALGGAVRAAERGAPLLLADPVALPTETDDALRLRRPERVTVHGGPVAISPDVVDAMRHALVDGPDAPRVVTATPAPGSRTSTLSPVTVTLSRPVTEASLEGSVTLDDVELPTTMRQDGDGTAVVLDPLTPGDLPLDAPREVVVRLRAADADGRLVHHLHRFVLQDRRVLATVGAIELLEPSTAVEVVGYHQSNHEGAQQMAPAADGPRWVTMESRGRRTGSRTSADVVADEHVEVVAPVTGRVVRSGTYVLYCDHTDNYLAIEPDGHPGIEVKMLHFRGLRVGPGDRVEAGETVVGDGPRRLPFRSQVDEYSSTGYGPHVHVEVVDTSIPNVPNGGSGSEDC